jgi:hypothetical protein
MLGAAKKHTTMPIKEKTRMHKNQNPLQCLLNWGFNKMIIIRTNLRQHKKIREKTEGNKQ